MMAACSLSLLLGAGRLGCWTSGQFHSWIELIIVESWQT